MRNVVLLFTNLVFLMSCSHKTETPDAYGNFETTETIVSAQGNGPLVKFTVHEGDLVKAGAIIGLIDTAQLHLKKEQLSAQISALYSQLPDSSAQLRVISQELDHAIHEQKRIERLLQGNAATPKQLDDINAQVLLLKRKYASLRSSLSVQYRSLLAQIRPLEIQMLELQDQIERYKIINPIQGIVLSTYVEPHEVVAFGKPLYKIGDLAHMILRAYVTEEQLPQLKIGSTVIVRTDNPDGSYHKWKGKVTWIADEAEFTPKQIQTKDERANLVYAIKISVKNDGTIKIGMPGEVLISTK